MADAAGQPELVPAVSVAQMVFNIENSNANVQEPATKKAKVAPDARCSFKGVEGEKRLHALAQALNRHLKLWLSRGTSKGKNAATIKICAELNNNPIFKEIPLKLSTCTTKCEAILPAWPGSPKQDHSIGQRKSLVCQSVTSVMGTVHFVVLQVVVVAGRSPRPAGFLKVAVHRPKEILEWCSSLVVECSESAKKGFIVWFKVAAYMHVHA